MVTLPSGALYKVAINNFLKNISAELLVETMAEGVLVFDLNGNIKSWNKAMEEMTGYTREEAIGKNYQWLRAPDCNGAQKILALLQGKEANSTSCVNGCRCKMLAKSGEEIPVLVNARLLKSIKGLPMGVIQTITDFRPVFTLQQEIQAMTSKLRAESSFQGIIGRSNAMQNVFRMIKLAAESEATVLILGDSGTGKEMVASAIHELSQRQNKTLVKVNCGAIPETLLESELFGHEKGSFTSAIKQRIGRFEAANGGTIFLDEIGDITPAMQVKLLRVLQEGEFERVGGEKTIKVNVRVIAATNKDLMAEVLSGTFREDLYYRLKVFPLHIPTLKERHEDIPLLTQHFINKFSARTGKLIKGIEKSALNQLCSYPWPGNVRELENAMEYAFVLSQNELISVNDLPPETYDPNYQFFQKLNNPVQVNFSKEEGQSLLRSKTKLIRLLEDLAWNKAEVSRRLSVSRTAVWKWMKKHNIPMHRPPN
jgi:PAS domain S-box-containing protein